MGCKNCKCLKQQEGKNEIHFGQKLAKESEFIENKNQSNIPLTMGNDPEMVKILNTDYQNANLPTKITSRGQEQDDSESINSNCISLNQERSDTLFDYFNEVKLYPQTFEKEAEAHGLLDIIQKAQENTDPKKALIKNPFFNLALDSLIAPNKIKGIIDDESEIINKLEHDSRLNDYNKELYIVEANKDNVTEAVWNLLEENKHRNKSHLLCDKIDILVIANIPIRGTHNFKAYFLFLKKKK